jgi:hypothetical protein
VHREATLALRLFGGPTDGLDEEGRELVAAVLDARREYEQALNYFHHVAEAELVDHAVLRLAAAERRYTYLLRQARRVGIRLPMSEVTTAVP